MVVNFSAVNLPVVIGAAVIDSINPCAFGVLIFLLAFLLKTVKKKSVMILNGVIYIFGVFVTYLVAGLVLLPIVRKLGQFSVWSYRIIGAIVIISGLLEIKDYFWYGKGFSLSIAPNNAKRIKMYTQKIGTKKITAFLLGCFVALVELPCTGAVYLAILALMSSSGFNISNVWFLLFYNLVFILPLAVILASVAYGADLNSFKSWREEHRGLMRLVIGVLLILMGVWMLYSVAAFKL